MPQSSEIFARLADHGVVVPASVGAQGAYDLVVVDNGLAYVSGQLPRGDGEGNVIRGRLGRDDELNLARSAAELCFARSLVALHQTLGDLAKVNRLISIRGYVNAEPTFERHGQVIDAASDLAIALFGEAGRHARTSIGVGGLPAGALVELEVVASIG